MLPMAAQVPEQHQTPGGGCLQWPCHGHQGTDGKVAEVQRGRGKRGKPTLETALEGGSLVQGKEEERGTGSLTLCCHGRDLFPSLFEWDLAP